jgi:type I restriction enzyme, S subunit
VNLQTLFDNFDLLAEVPNGVEKLRELILQLAVQGKLVPQAPNDESASILIREIQDEKDWMTKKKRIKKQKQLPAINPDNIPFAIPSGWQWVRCGDLGNSIDNAIVDGPFGSNLLLSDYDSHGTYPVLTISNLDKGFFLDEMRKINQTKFDQLKRSAVYPGDILMAKIGSSYGKTGLYPECMPIGVIPANMLKITIHPKVNKFYLINFLRSPIFKKQLEGIVKFTAQPAFNVTVFKSLLVSLPPLAEQNRIVAKVDELMKLCDELEHRQQKKREARVRLNESALDYLLAASTPDEFNAHWQCICDNFDLLYDTPETIGRLRQSILQLAIQGKLITQNPNDESASVLLERIKTKREGLIKKKVKKVETLPPNDSNSVPFKVPQKWVWVRFCDIATIASNLVQPNSYLDFPHIAPDNIEKQTGKLLPYQTVREDEVRSSNHKFFAGQIIYSKIRPNLSKAIIVDFDGLCSADMYPINAHIDPRFLLKYILSQTFLSMAVKTDTRVAMPKINQDELNRILVPVPPLKEQKRIVAKVDQLMKLCDELEARLTQAQRLSENLVASIVNHLSTTQESETARAALSI